jgi:uncharacterized protein (DUF2249 family)
MNTSTSSPLVEAIHTHHAELERKLVEYAGQLDAGIDQIDVSLLAALLTQLGSFLTDELLPHAQGEECVLYPALDPVIAQHGSPTATMRVDHEYLTRFIQQATELAGRLRSAGPRERDPFAAQLQQVLAQLRTLLTVHLAKEERVYLPLVEQHFSLAEQQRVLGELHESAAQTPKVEDGHELLDVRSLPPAQRHSLIFARFAALAEGDWFILVNDHDPKPLYYQLNAEYRGALIWDYLEQGPQDWRVRVGKGTAGAEKQSITATSC